MLGIRVAWFVVAATAVGLGIAAANWPMYQITDCELGLSMGTESCQQSLWNYFGFPLALTLAVPVVLSLIAAIVCKSWMSWLVAGILLVSTALGFMTAIGAETPSLISTLGTLPGTVLAVLLASVHQVVTFSADRPRSNRVSAERSLRP